MKEHVSIWRWTLGGVLLTSALGLGLTGIMTSNVQADRSGYEHDDDDNKWTGSRWGGVEKNDLYQQECGDCHLAYPPQLLPPQSWEQVMDNLDNHYGDNAELELNDKKQIQNYLLNYAAGRYNYGSSNKFMSANMDRSGPPRITELRYFLKEHDEIPQRLVSTNKQVSSFSQCDACHKNAVAGDFDEDEVSIPGYGRWDD
ncbi:MAG: hypothetical protein V7739_04625 [Motiliproteus sp.]